MIDEKLEHNDVVISSRIRLVRNIADYPFVSTCSDDQRAEIESAVRSGLKHDEQLKQLTFVDSLELESLERQFLLDLQLVSVPANLECSPVPNLGQPETPGSDDSGKGESDRSDPVRPQVVEDESTILEPDSFDPTQPFDDASLTLNEEDHLRITVTRSDLDLGTAWQQINQLDDRIEKHLNYAFSPRWGYLTACPANVGTGMRVSVLVHLPALVMTDQIEKVFRSLQRINVVARGAFGENAIGDFFRISNQATLGVDESELIEQVSGVIPALVKYERQAREFLLAENREGVRREVAEALELLCRLDLEENSEESNLQMMTLLSTVRMGAGMGLLHQQDVNRVNRMFALVDLRHQLLAAVAREDYQQASKLRDQIQRLGQGRSEGGTP